MMFSLKVDEELTLHPYHEHEAEQVFALVDRNRDYLRQWLPWVDRTLSPVDTQSFIRQELQKFAENGSFAAGIWHKEELVGSIGLHEVHWNDRKSTLGYWLSADRQGQGIITRSCRAVLNYAFAELKLNRMTIQAAVGNDRSRAILERLGFVQEGILRQAIWVNDSASATRVVRFLDLVVYGMLTHEWKG